jgi:predicted nucleic acid-binding protein
VIEEPESAALARFLRETPHVLATSRIATVEVLRAVDIANRRGHADAERLLGSCLLVDVSPGVLLNAARLTSHEVRTLDAIHLATAQSVSADGVLAYDRRLARAARHHRFTVHTPV